LKYRLLGKSGLRVSEASLGTMTFSACSWVTGHSVTRLIYDSHIRNVKQETRSLVSFSDRDFAHPLEGVEFFPLLWIEHIVDPSLQTRVGPH
jgi:hypothetical protein